MLTPYERAALARYERELPALEAERLNLRGASRQLANQRIRYRRKRIAEWRSKLGANHEAIAALEAALARVTFDDAVAALRRVWPAHGS